MKKFGVIHHSDNWMFGPSIPKFDTLPEAEKYVKDFRSDCGGHKNDRADIIEIISRHESHVADQTETKKIWGLREEK